MRVPLFQRKAKVTDDKVREFMSVRKIEPTYGRSAQAPAPAPAPPAATPQSTPAPQQATTGSQLAAAPAPVEEPVDEGPDPPTLPPVKAPGSHPPIDPAATAVDRWKSRFLWAPVDVWTPSHLWTLGRIAPYGCGTDCWRAQQCTHARDHRPALHGPGRDRPEGHRHWHSPFPAHAPSHGAWNPQPCQSPERSFAFV